MAATFPHPVCMVLDNMIEKAYDAALCAIVSSSHVSPGERYVEASDSQTDNPVPALRFVVTERELTISDGRGRSVSFSTDDPMLPLWCAGAVSELVEQPA